MANYHSLKNAGLAKPAASTDLGSSSNKYGNLFLDGNITLGTTVVNSNNVINPKIASISYSGDDTATSIAGGQTVTLNGAGFGSGATVLIGTTPATSTTVVSSTQITFIPPATAAGTYVLYVINSDGGTATFVTGISFSGTPTWTTSAGNLGTVINNNSVNLSVAATGDATITYAVKAGSSLPSGLSLNTSTGAITGTAPSPESSTVYNFTLTAIDGQNQDTDRAFSITIMPAFTVEYLVVAGGGGASTYSGAGAGGFRTNTGFILSLGTPYTVTVGAGGAGTFTTYGNYGSDSVFSTITSTGGGRGVSSGVGGDGGSGGGGYGGLSPGSAGGSGNTPSTSPSQGNNGGRGLTDDVNYTAAGGGGGAGAVGGNAAYQAGGNGGNGTASLISGSSVTYAGGGGGRSNAGTSGSGGTGGGGAGTNSGPGTSGSTNTGGGGGGGPGGSGGGSGGSGVVIIRYSDVNPSAASTTGSPTITAAGGYRVYKFTSSGSITF